MVADTPPPSDSPPPAAPQAGGTKPQIDLGPGLEPIAFEAGRYASAVQRATEGAHALQELREDSTALFILELAADGTATACRGWRYISFNDGPDIHTEERFREQQGYRGRHVSRAGFVDVELAADDSVCPPKREYAQLVPRRSSTVKLRCVLAAPHGHPSLTTPALLCQWVDMQTGEPDAHIVEGIAPAGWMVLGSGNGLRIKLTGAPAGAMTGDPTKVVVEVAQAPLGSDAWEHSF